MPDYSFQEKVEMILIFGECQRSPRRAAREYALRFPAARHPSHTTIIDVVKRFQATGHILKRKTGPRRRQATTPDNQATVLNIIFENPTVSTRTLAARMDISRSSIRRILKANKFHPFHVSLHQGLNVSDYVQRFEWCNWMLNKLDEDPHFYRRILFTDEAKFHRDGVVNLHNAHYWSVDNPHWLREGRHQANWSFNVWCGVFGNHLLGPIFYDGTLTASKYLALLRDEIADAIDDLPIAETHLMWYQHDGAPPHTAHIVRHELNLHYPDRWLGQGGVCSWPPRSPDLTPLDYCIWGLLKGKVYATAPANSDDLKERIRGVCRSLGPVIFQSMESSFVKRLQHCVVVNGEHFEHIL